MSDVILPDSLLDNANFTTGPNGENIMELDVTFKNGGVTNRTFGEVIDQINTDWNTGHVTIGDVTYEIKVNITTVDASKAADVTVLRTMSGNHRVDRLGGSKLYIKEIRAGTGGWINTMRSHTASHEFGHLLGLQHQNNFTGRLMSYASSRSMSPYRVQDLYRAYSQGLTRYNPAAGNP